jgi:hypothetical protein
MFKSGTFITGANYWASHAGTAMWRDFRPEVIESDFKKLAALGLSVLRVFPLWPDFQPIHQLYTGEGARAEMRFGEIILPDEGPGYSGVDSVMLERFVQFADLAEKYKLKLIVGLVTGWMSGRLFIPPALEGRNPITDPVSRMWQVRLVKTLVRHLKKHPAIGAWDLGNECNVMGRGSREETYTWIQSISDSIRAEDATRPVISGMHSLVVDNTKPWNLRDQGELVDFLTTHPYPPFTPHAGLDPVGTIRASLHAAAETRLYADVGRKPAFIEEAGNLGPFFGNAEFARAHMRSMLVTGWMEDERALLWWCAFDQSHLEQAPYDWNAVERELGLLKVNGEAKPVASEMASFKQFLSTLPFSELPQKQIDAVCLLGPDIDQWGTAYASFVIGAQAGIGLRFANGTESIPDSPLYLMPSVGGMRGIPRRNWMALLTKVEQGATLYLSLHDGIIAEFERITGFEIEHRSAREGDLISHFEEAGEKIELRAASPIRLKLKPTRAEVWAREPDGNPSIGVVRYGKGKIVTNTLPLEISMISKNGTFQGPNAVAAWRLWRRIFSISPVTSKLIRKTGKNESRDVIVTEHPHGNNSSTALIYNLSNDPAILNASLSNGAKIELVSSYPIAAKLSSQSASFSVELAPYGLAVCKITH